MIGPVGLDDAAVDVDVGSGSTSQERSTVIGVGGEERVCPESAHPAGGQIVGAAADGSPVDLSLGEHMTRVESESADAPAVATTDAGRLVVHAVTVSPQSLVAVGVHVDVAAVHCDFPGALAVCAADAGSVAAAPRDERAGVGRVQLADGVAGAEARAIGEHCGCADSTVRGHHFAVLVVHVAADLGGVAHRVVDDEHRPLAAPQCCPVITVAYEGEQGILGIVGQGEVAAGGIGRIEPILVGIGHDVERHAVFDVHARQCDVGVHARVHLNARGAWGPVAMAGCVGEGERGRAEHFDDVFSAVVGAVVLHVARRVHVIFPVDAALHTQIPAGDPAVGVGR